MKYLFGRWKEIEPKLKENRLLLFLDYDGTLASITGRPENARLSPEVKELLRRLSRLAGCKLVIISGRSLRDLKQRVGLEGIIYSGNHGLEIEGPKIRFRAALPHNYRGLLKKLATIFKRELSTIKGIIIENKELTLSVHYRLAAKQDIAVIKSRFDETVRQPLSSGKIETKTGKKVLEIRPAVKWDKGKAALWLLARQRFAWGKAVLPIYLGDDITDEDAFLVLQNRGLTILVGRPQRGFSADYYVRDNPEMQDLLQRLIKLKG